MSGWTPAFGTIYTGTLFGKWPAAPVWASLLPLIDKNGCIEMTFEAIAGMTGWPMDLLREGISQLCQPDPGSRSEALGGRRLVLLDERRQWGWRAVNHTLYRERARLQAKNAKEVASGVNATRMDRRRPPETAETSRGPPPTPSQTHTQTQTQEEETSLRSVSPRTGARARPKTRRVPQDFRVTEEMRKWAREVSPSIDIDRETEAFRDHQFRDAHSDWEAAWRQWMRRAPDFKRNVRSQSESPVLTWRPPADEDANAPS